MHDKSGAYRPRFFNTMRLSDVFGGLAILQLRCFCTLADTGYQYPRKAEKPLMGKIRICDKMSVFSHMAHIQQRNPVF